MNLFYENNDIEDYIKKLYNNSKENIISRNK